MALAVCFDLIIPVDFGAYSFISEKPSISFSSFSFSSFSFSSFSLPLLLSSPLSSTSKFSVITESSFISFSVAEVSKIRFLLLFTVFATSTTVSVWSLIFSFFIFIILFTGTIDDFVFFDVSTDF